jgi:hypothetical protein
MKLYVVPNYENKKSKVDGKVYKYYTRQGKIIAFYKNSSLWNVYCARAKRKPFYIRNYHIQN